MPRFEVIIETAREVIIDEEEIRLKVFAYYTFGKLVKGTAQVTAEAYQVGNSMVYASATKSSAAPSYETSFIFNIRKDLNIYNAISSYDIQLNDEFEEKLTGQRMNQSTTVRLANLREYNIEIKREKQRFKPGFDYTFQVFVHKLDGSIIKASVPSLDVFVKYHMKAPKCSLKTSSKHLDDTKETVVKKNIRKKSTDFTLQVPENATAFELHVRYVDAITTVNVVRYQTNSRKYLTA